MATRDIIAIGASAGEIVAHRLLVAGFPVDLRASVFITLHIHPRGPGTLPRLLSRAGPLPSVQAMEGMTIPTLRLPTIISFFTRGPSSSAMGRARASSAPAST